MKSYQQLFAELKRRKVFRVMAVYGAVGFAVIEAAGEIFPRVGIPDWAVTLVVWLTLLGFPIAVVLAWAFESSPEGMRRTADATDEEIEAIIAQPASRRWPAGLLALAGAALLFGGWWLGQRGAGEAGLNLAPAGAEAAGFPEIAVLPFEDLGGNEEDDPLLNLHVDVLTKLTTVGDLRVTQPASAAAYANTTKDVRTIAEELGNVDYLVQGSVRRAGNRARINVRLVDVATNQNQTIEDWDGEVTVENVFEVQSAIALKVARQLQAQLSPQDIERLEAGLSTTNPEAINAYHRARAEWLGGSRGSAEPVLVPLERAVELDPGFVEAWAFIAHVASYWAQVDRERSAPALEAVSQAERLAPNSLEAVKARGWYTYYVENDFDRALTLMREAERRAPSDSDVLAGIGFILHRLGEFEEGNRTIKRAADLDPLNPGRLMNLANALARVAKWDAADAVVERAQAIDPSNELAQWYEASLVLRRERDSGHARRLADELGRSAANLGEAGSFEFALMERDYDAAVQILSDALVEGSEHIVALRRTNYLALWAWVEQKRGGSAASVLDSLRTVIGPDSSVTGIYRLKQAAAWMVLGEEEAGMELLARIVEEARSSADRLARVDDLWEAALVYAQFGKTERALALLDEAVARPSNAWWSAAELHLDPRFDSLRDDPRFDELIARQEAYEAAQAREAATEDWLP
jgi:TolB-like protein/Tfp pilus assembly protein PilF